MSSCSLESFIFSSISLILIALFILSLIYEDQELKTASLILYFIGAPLFLDLLFTLVAAIQVRSSKHKSHQY